MIKVANAPCSWGVLEFDLEGEVAGYSQVLDEMVQTGYAGTELGDWGFFPTDPRQLKDELNSRNLSLLGAFVPVDFSNEDAHPEGEKDALRIAELLSHVGDNPFIILADDNGKNKIRTSNAGRIRPEHGLNDNEWDVFAKGVERVAKSVKDSFNLRTVFHHHCGGFVETPHEVNKLLSITDPNLLGLCLDTGHYCFGGGDPIEAFQLYPNRIWHVHFKDCHPKIAEESRIQNWNYFDSVRNGVFCELGKGHIDFKDILNELVNIKYEGLFVVEQDILPGMGTPKECALSNRQHLKSIGL